MKRSMAFAIILVGLVSLGQGQYRPRVIPRRIFQLPEPGLMGSLSLEEVLLKRRSVRQFTAQPLKSSEIGQLAWAGQGITEPQTGFRTAPSAGATYPVRLYLATAKGLFIYDPVEHGLEQLSDLDVRAALAAAAVEQDPVAEAACDIIIAGSTRELAAKYGKSAKKFLLLEAGHIAQNILLQAVSLELGAVPIGAFDIRQVNKICNLPKTVEPIYIICVGHPVAAQIEEDQEAGQKRAALIVASRDFRDEELFETRRILERAEIRTVIASSRTGPLQGMLGGTAEATSFVRDLIVDDYDAIVFIGGVGAMEYFDSPAALSIAREAADKKKVLAAICVAPTILANAGLLRGVRATSFLSEREALQVAGANYTGSPLERDGLIITARDPVAAAMFGQAIADAIAGTKVGSVGKR